MCLQKICLLEIFNQIQIQNINATNEIQVDLKVNYTLELILYKENPIITFKIIDMIPDNPIYDTVCQLNNNILVEVMQVYV